MCSELILCYGFAASILSPCAPMLELVLYLCGNAVDALGLYNFILQVLT